MTFPYILSLWIPFQKKKKKDTAVGAGVRFWARNPVISPRGLSSCRFQQDWARNANHQRFDGLRTSCSVSSPVCPSSIQEKWAMCTPWSKFYLFARGILQMFLLLPPSNQELRFLNLLWWFVAEREARFKVAGICIRMERAEQGEVRSTGTRINGTWAVFSEWTEWAVLRVKAEKKRKSRKHSRWLIYRSSTECGRGILKCEMKYSSFLCVFDCGGEVGGEKYHGQWMPFEEPH